MEILAAIVLLAFTALIVYCMLDAAYRKVVLPKLQADRNKVREEVLAEIKARPTTTSVPTPAPATPTPKTRTTEDIVREIIAKGGR